jgi:hypothetical protein
MNSTNEKLPLETVLNNLKSNKADFTELSLTKIIANPQPSPYEEVPFTYHYDDEALLKLAEALKFNTSLKVFEISHSISFFGYKPQWTPVGALAIGNALKNHPNLEAIDITLRTSQLESNAIINFLDCLTGTAPIKCLSFSFSHDDTEFMNNLAQALMRNKSLEFIYLKGPLGHTDNPSVFETEVFVQGLTASKKLRRLKLKNIPLGNSGIKTLSTNLSTYEDLQNLKVLELNQCSFTGEAMRDLIPALGEHCDAIEVLSLSGNKLQYEGAHLISTQLSLFKNLEQLELRDTGICKKSLDCLVTGLLESKCPLRILALDSNHFQLDSMHSIRKLVKNNSTLKALSMSSCQLVDKHLLALIDLLENPNECFMESFKFVDNFALEAKTCQRLLNAVRKNHNLCCLELPGHLPGSSLPLIKNALEVNITNKIRKSQGEFVRACIELANLYYGDHQHNRSIFNPFSFPAELILQIMVIMGKGTVEMSEKDVKYCAKQILENFEKRRLLIGEGEYNPTVHAKKSYQSICSWWSNPQNAERSKRLIPSSKIIEHSKEGIKQDRIQIAPKR